MPLAMTGPNRYGPPDFKQAQPDGRFHGTARNPSLPQFRRIGPYRDRPKEFQCVGARPPFDHPHVFLDMGHDTEIVCPYCSTLYIFSPALPHGAANPPSAVFEVEHA